MLVRIMHYFAKYENGIIRNLNLSSVASLCMLSDSINFGV